MSDRVTAWLVTRDDRWLDIDWPYDDGRYVRALPQPHRRPLLEDSRGVIVADLAARAVEVVDDDDDYLVLDVDGDRWSLRAGPSTRTRT